MTATENGRFRTLILRIRPTSMERPCSKAPIKTGDAIRITDFTMEVNLDERPQADHDRPSSRTR